MWPFTKKTISPDAYSVQDQVANALKSMSLPELSPKWRLSAQNDSNWSTATAIAEGYNASSVVYTCVEKRAKLISSVPWRAMRRLADGELEPAPDSELQRLIDAPNPDMSTMELMHTISQSLDLAGNGYLTKVRAGVRSQPKQLWPLPASYVRIKPGTQQLIDEYEYTEAGRKIIPADDMVHLRLPNPGSRYFGQPVLMAAGRATDIDRESGDWQKASLQNRGVLDIHVEVPDGTPEEAVTAIRESLTARQSSPANARKPIVTSAKIQQLGQNAVEMDFVQSRKAVWGEICAVFGMSMADLGFTESVNLANAQAMNAALWKNTILPQLELIKRQLNAQLAEDFGGEYVLEYDISNVEALQENFTEKLTNAEKLWRLGFSLEAINNRLELGFDTDDIEEPETEEAEEEELEEPETDEEKRLLRLVGYGR